MVFHTPVCTVYSKRIKPIRSTRAEKRQWTETVDDEPRRRDVFYALLQFKKCNIIRSALPYWFLSRLWLKHFHLNGRNAWSSQITNQVSNGQKYLLKCVYHNFYVLQSSYSQTGLYRRSAKILQCTLHMCQHYANA